MPQKQITVVAMFLAKPDKIAPVHEALMALVELTRREQGCINYDLHQNSDDPRRFVFYENWACMDDLEKHRESAHLKTLVKQADELFAEPADVTLWEKI